MSTRILTDGRAFVYAQIAGMIAILLLGMTAAIVVVFAAFWLASQFVLLVFSSLSICISQMGYTWQTANSLTRLLMLVTLALVCYWIARKRLQHA